MHHAEQEPLDDPSARYRSLDSLFDDEQIEVAALVGGPDRV
jgi:hypothetical protein